ncbi:hypothetical protein [Paraburkholderia humisilvae]|uniref:hypothetical protein n=1 Tax=Paraburkholderia humisilvae TaxID=627669 RepID=UPI0015824D81|nr:hypothetical protein [Paraburkholderia humisilvae]
MPCAARHQEASSFEFILNPFKFFFTNYVKKSPHSECGQASLEDAVSVTYNLRPLATIKARINAATPSLPSAKNLGKQARNRIHPAAHPASVHRAIDCGVACNVPQTALACAMARSKCFHHPFARGTLRCVDNRLMQPLSHRRFRHLRKLIQDVRCGATHCAAP